MKSRKTLEIYCDYDDTYRPEDLEELSRELSSESGMNITISEKASGDGRLLIVIVGD